MVPSATIIFKLDKIQWQPPKDKTTLGLNNSIKEERNRAKKKIQIK
jgi:hypothetical protein